MMKRIIATGISGVGEKSYFKALQEYSERRGKRVGVFHAGEMLLDRAADIGLNLNSENILNADPDLLNALRLSVFKDIDADIAKNAGYYDAVIFSVHSFFYWKKRFHRAHDRSLGQFAPDLFLTCIDDGAKILERLSGRAQWRDEGLTALKVLDWQNIEVETTSGLADFVAKPFFALAVAQPISTLHKLMFHPEIEPVYVAMPITHLKSPEARARIDIFIRRLDRYFAVFNPLAIDMVGAVPLDDPNFDLTPHHHTVHRDLYWLVRQAKKIIVYWPEKIVPSPGREHETHAAFTKTKDVWVIYPGEGASPFVTYFNTKIFHDEESFFKFLDERYPERKDLNWD